MIGMKNKIVYMKIAWMFIAIFIGFISTVSAAEIHGIKWNDANGNGTMDTDEIGVNNVSICIYSTVTIPCTSTDANGYYSFTGLNAGNYYVYEILPGGTVQTYPANAMGSNWSFATGAFHVVTLLQDEIRTGINFGNRNLIPLPLDVSLVQQSGSQDSVPTVSQDGIPYIIRPSLTNLQINKTLSSFTDVLSVKLTMTWIEGTIKTADMINYSGIWEADIAPPYPPGTAQMKFEVDRYPAGPSENDMIEIGDIIFIDPSGKILNYCTNNPIEGAVVSLYVREQLTGNFVLSPAENQIPSTNPLTTGPDGNYSWMTKTGWYKVKAEKTNFVPNWSPQVFIPPPVSGLDIRLIPIGGCADIHFGIRPPINSDGSSIFKLKSTIPVKFQLWNMDGIFITDKEPRIYLSKITTDIMGSEIEDTSTSWETTGNLFRYESTENQYIFNLGTKDLSAGTWEIKILVDNDLSYSVKVSLK